MNPYNSSIIRVLGQIWALPNTIVSLIYLAIMWTFGQIKPVRKTRISILWVVVSGSRVHEYMEQGNWRGWSSGANIIISHPVSNKLIAHENRHVQQQMVFGIFHLPLYFLEMLRIKLLTNKKPYRDNRFEIDAYDYASNINNQDKEIMPWK